MQRNGNCVRVPTQERGNEENSLLFTFPSSDKKGKIAVSMGYVEKVKDEDGGKGLYIVNSVRSAGLIQSSDLSGNKFKRIN